MNKCGCPPIKEKFEYPITELNSYQSYFTNSNFSLFPRSCTIDDLKRKVVKEFYGILNKLQCGIYQNLDFLLDEISLIDKYKYDQWSEEYNPSSTYQFINPTKNTSSGIDLDQFYTKDEIDDILKQYIQEGDITNNFEDIINLPSTLDGYGIVDAVSKEELSELEEEFLKSEFDPTVPSWAKQPDKPTYTAEEVGALPENTPLFSGSYNDLTNKPEIGAIGVLQTFNVNLPDNTFNQPLSSLRADAAETFNMFGCSTLEEFNSTIITKIQQGYYAKVIYDSNESICQAHYVNNGWSVNIDISGLFYNYVFTIIVTIIESNISTQVKYIRLQNFSNLQENKSILNYLTTESSNPNFIANSSGNWTLSSDYRHWIYPTNGLRKITITANSTVSTYYTFLKTYTKGSTSTPDYATGYSTTVGVPAGQTVNVIVPLDAYYLYLNTGLNEAAKPEEILVTGVSVVERRGTSSQFVKADGSVDSNSYQQEINVNNKLNADFIQDGTTNKVINVKPNWNASAGTAAEILNKPNSLSAFQNDQEFLSTYDFSLNTVQFYGDIPFVDLGLPSGTLWARYNIGAQNEEYQGDYFLYGATSPIEEEPDYYTGIENPLRLERDVAYNWLEYGWHIPSEEQFKELLENTTYEWVNDYNNTQDCNGLLFTGYNGKKLFLRAGGYKYLNSNNQIDSGDPGVGYYWTCTPNAPDNSDSPPVDEAIRLTFESNGDAYTENWERYNAFSIRPVIEPHRLICKRELDAKPNREQLSQVAYSGNYQHLTSIPTLNTTATTAQSTSSSQALSGNVTLHKVAKTGTYSDLIGTPTIPAAQVNSDWDANSGVAQILHKPTIPTVPTNVSAFTNDAGYLTSHQDISGKEDKVAIDSTAKTASFSASVGNYYFVNIAASGSVTITLTTPSDNTKLSSATFLVTTSTSPALTFSAASGVDIYKSTSYSIESSKVYEINAMWNGSSWCIASVEMEVQS